MLSLIQLFVERRGGGGRVTVGPVVITYVHLISFFIALLFLSVGLASLR